jgi:tetratricopeptide (TPR) repeat protein
VKRLEEALDIGPKYAEQFQRNHIRTVKDLAKSDDLPGLSLSTDIPLELLKQWHAQALRRVKASRYRHRIAVLIAVMVAIALGWEIRALFQSPNISSQGDAFYADGKYESAIERYNKAIELNPNSEVAYTNKGSALRMLGRYPEAIAALEKAVALNPQYVLAYNERGAVYSDEEKYDQAIANYDKAIELDPGNKFAYGLKGSALSALGRYPEALVALDKAIELDPQYVWAYDERGAVYSSEEKYDLAIVEYEKALELDPKYKFAYAKAFPLRKLGRYNDALDALNQAIAIDPQWRWPYGERGSIYHDDLFQFEPAYRDLKKLSELNDDYDVKANLAEAALTSGRLAEAYDLATKLLAENENTDASKFDASERCAMRFITISALLLQGETAQAKVKLEEFIKYYKSVAPSLERRWDYSGTQHFIAGQAKDGASKRIILDLIKLLQIQPQIRIERIEESVSTLR